MNVYHLQGQERGGEGPKVSGGTLGTDFTLRASASLSIQDRMVLRWGCWLGGVPSTWEGPPDERPPPPSHLSPSPAPACPLPRASVEAKEPPAPAAAFHPRQEGSAGRLDLGIRSRCLRARRGLGKRRPPSHADGRLLLPCPSPPPSRRPGPPTPELPPTRSRREGARSAEAARGLGEAPPTTSSEIGPPVGAPEDPRPFLPLTVPPVPWGGENQSGMEPKTGHIRGCCGSPAPLLRRRNPGSGQVLGASWANVSQALQRKPPSRGAAA